MNARIRQFAEKVDIPHSCVYCIVLHCIAGKETVGRRERKYPSLDELRQNPSSKTFNMEWYTNRKVLRHRQVREASSNANKSKGRLSAREVKHTEEEKKEDDKASGAVDQYTIPLGGATANDVFLLVFLRHSCDSSNERITASRA